MSEVTSEERRVLVLGSAPHARAVDAYRWDEIPPAMHIADYDIVILNLVPFMANDGLASRVNNDNMPTATNFAHLLFSHGSEIIVIGMPDEDNKIDYWLPLVPECTIEQVQEIRQVNPEFEYYFQRVRGSPFHTSRKMIRSCYPRERDYLRFVDPFADILRWDITPIAQTRFHTLVAFRLNFLGGVHSLVESEGWGLTSGTFIWLPPPTEITSYDAVDLILRERYDLHLEHSSPDWVKLYKLPNQLPLEDEIDQVENEIQDQKKRLAAVQKQLKEETRFQRLLFEQGEDGLEPVVRDTLRELGACVEDPKTRGREDGRLVDPKGRKYMLEIKGRTNSVRLSDVRQLQQWVDDAIVEEDWEGKGLLAANAYCNAPVGCRDEPFPDNCIKAATRLGQCLLTSTQLFNALSTSQLGKFDVEDFWDTIASTDGVCPLPELEPLSEYTDQELQDDD